MLDRCLHSPGHMLQVEFLQCFSLSKLVPIKIIQVVKYGETPPFAGK